MTTKVRVINYGPNRIVVSTSLTGSPEIVQADAVSTPIHVYPGQEIKIIEVVEEKDA